MKHLSTLFAAVVLLTASPALAAPDACEADAPLLPLVLAPGGGAVAIAADPTPTPGPLPIRGVTVDQGGAAPGSAHIERPPFAGQYRVLEAAPAPAAAAGTMDMAQPRSSKVRGPRPSPTPTPR